MKRNIFALVVGLIFGLGLCLSGMYEPAKVIGFLDLAGNWDPSLAFVMGGAIVVALPAFWLARRRSAAWVGGAIELPTKRAIDAPLVVGAGDLRDRLGPRRRLPGAGRRRPRFLEPRRGDFRRRDGGGHAGFRASPICACGALRILAQDA